MSEPPKSKLRLEAEKSNACCPWFFLRCLPWGTYAERAAMLGVSERRYARYLQRMRSGKLMCEGNEGCVSEKEQEKFNA